jgi:hypothetical protein
MGKETGFEGYDSRVRDRDHSHNDAQALSANQWDSMYADARNRATYGDPDNTGYTVFNTLKMVPTSFAAFAGKREASVGGTGVGLGIMFGADYLIDKTFFNDQPIRGGSLAFDFVAPAAIMFTPLSMKYKVAAGIGSHIVGKLLDKYGK